MMETLNAKINSTMYAIIDLYFKDNGDHFTVFFISTKAMTLAKGKEVFKPHLYSKGKNLYINVENHLLSEFMGWAMDNNLKFDRGDFQLPSTDATQTEDDRYTIGATVVWKGRNVMITNRFRNGTLVISPKGNGNNPAKYYTVKEHEVTLI